ncbi:MAG: protein kinase [Gemmatimonadota bacterium]|nr:protein kinase [Gemmatimonadota bacterium]
MSDAADGGHGDAIRRRVIEAVGGIFDVENEIGRGGMAVVYRARDRRLRRHVALKVLPPELAFRADVRSRFLREAQLAAQLAHPNIVPIYAVDETGGVVWFSMGLVQGESLARLLANDVRPDVAFVRRVLQEVAAGLAYAHEHGVVHRDVKPDNILIERGTSRAVVTDFGIARAAEGDLRLTATGVAVGTPAYMSPEQAMGEKDVDGRADIYALGVVGWQMLAGELPFQSENTPGMLMKHISEPPRPLSVLRPDLPANLVYAIERAMAKSRADRWPDALAFRDALGEGAPAPADVFSNARTPAEPVPAASPGGAPASAPAGARGPSPNKPWRFDPMRDAALQGETGAHAIRKWREERHAWRERHGRDAQAIRENVRDTVMDHVRSALEHEPLSRRERRLLRMEERDKRLASRSPEDRIRSAQRAIFSFATMSAFFAAVNFFTSPHFPWFIFPVLGMGIGLMSRISGLWVDGIPVSRLFRRQPADGAARSDDARGGDGAALGGGVPRSARAPARLPSPDLSGVPRDVLDGPHGATVREAAEAKLQIIDVVSRLTPDEVALLPDVAGTVTGLEARVRSLASALHQLDRDANPMALQRLEQRIADASAAGGTGAEAERRLALLERQRATLRDLAERRDAVASQLDSAALLLQTMKLDLLRLRSSGIEARIADSTLGTQEARAVATDIERVVEAANEVRKL